MGGITRGTHVHDNVVERCCLRDLPVKAGGRRRDRHGGDIDMDVPDRAVAVECISVSEYGRTEKKKLTSCFG